MLGTLNFILITKGRQLRDRRREEGEIGEREGQREGEKRKERKKEKERGRMEGREGCVTSTQASPWTVTVAKVRMVKSCETIEPWNSIFFFINKVTFHYHSPTGVSMDKGY